MLGKLQLKYSKIILIYAKLGDFCYVMRLCFNDYDIVF